MYNGIGLQTARGTGTNGYVQANLSHLMRTTRRIEYNAEDDIKRAEAAINRKPNEELLDHLRKRQIEMKCTEFEILMEQEGYEADDIEKKVSDYRRLLLSKLESGELNVDDELNIKDSHAKMKFAKEKRSQWQEALGIGKDFVAGSSMQNMNKNDPLAQENAAAAAEKAKAEEEEKKMKKLVKLARKKQKEEEKAKRKKKKEKKKRKAAKKRKQASSSSSSSSSSSDSSDSSDSDSSDSDSSESSSEDSDREERKRRKAKSKKEMLKKRKEMKKEEPDSGEDEDRERKAAGRDVRRGEGSNRETREREERRRRRDTSEEDAEMERKRRRSGGNDERDETTVARKDSRSSSASPYVDSDLDDETRARMKGSLKSTVTVIKK